MIGEGTPPNLVSKPFRLKTILMHALPKRFASDDRGRRQPRQSAPSPHRLDGIMHSNTTPALFLGAALEERGYNRASRAGKRA
jgi:hypothetical protein